jgi:hypothetical protein
VEELAGALAAAEAESRALEVAAGELDALEERYFHDFNDFKAQLRAHVGERDALLSKIDRAVCHSPEKDSDEAYICIRIS